MKTPSDFRELVNQLRKGEIVLWIGSGFSTIAGFPSTRELVKIFNAKIKSNNPDFEEKQNLDDVTEEFIQTFSRSELERILLDIFNEKPTNLFFHQMVTKIPQVCVECHN